MPSDKKYWKQIVRRKFKVSEVKPKAKSVKLTIKLKGCSDGCVSCYSNSSASCLSCSDKFRFAGIAGLQG